jgi:3',5'-cyclic AMP phosphodiesterase CpdA
MAEPQFVPDLAFLHLSDIHFREGRMGDAHDVDTEIRNELERDLRIVRSTRVPKLDGIVISGDIAFAGQPQEFDYARGWIEKVRELLDCPESGVMVTPGNHDVDRAPMADGGPIDVLQTRVRADQSLQNRDDLIASLLRDKTDGPLLLSGMTAYNNFAQNFDCRISAEKPYWERDFRLGNKGTLRIRGMTSTLVSGPRDHGTTHKLVYGGAQRTLIREDRVWRLIAGHHPPSWTLEGDEADRVFSNRAAIQLFGHKHDQWFAKVEKGIRLIAGAVHPDRAESNWEPRYSMIAIKLEDSGDLAIRVYPRRWSREELMFIGDFNSRGQDYRDHVVPWDAAAQGAY